MQILHADAGRHWVTITNYNPFYEGRNGEIGCWFIYDSLTNPESIIEDIKPALKRININRSRLILLSCDLPRQHGVTDCGYC